MIKDDIKIGTPVIYWKTIINACERYDPVKTEITSEPWELGHGAIVCKVKGISGGVSIEHLDPVTFGSLIAAQMAGLEEITDEMIMDTIKQTAKEHGAENTEVRFSNPNI